MPQEQNDEQQAGSNCEPKRMILIVDDDRDTRDVLAHFLQTTEYAIRTANDGVEGWDMAAEFSPKIVFVDIRMPRMNGFELCARIRAGEGTKEAAVFALTAGLEGAELSLNPSAHFDAILIKPIEFEVIGALVNSTAGSVGTLCRTDLTA